MAELKRYRVHLYASDDGEIYDLGSVMASSMENAFHRGIASYVAVGDTAAEKASRIWGGHRDDYPDAFFTVREHEPDDLPSAAINNAEVTENYPFRADQ